jgi:hypothetical protein
MNLGVKRISAVRRIGSRHRWADGETGIKGDERVKTSKPTH